MSWISIETSSPWVSMAFGRGEECLQEVEAEGNASVLIELLFRRLKVNLSELDKVVIGKGPGSYNGLRVGYGFVKGLLCLEVKPVVEVATYFTLARMALDRLAVSSGEVLVLNNARRGEWYGALVRWKEHRLEKVWEKIVPRDELLNGLPDHLAACVSYDFLERDFGGWKGAPLLNFCPKASVAAKIAREQLILPAENLSLLEPHYVREAVPPHLNAH